MPHYIGANGFNGLHGRALPPAIGIKLSNKDLTVIAESGDGDTYGEGGNHFIHTIRRNVNIAHFVHDNQIYGLTKGQGSPTTAMGQVTTLQYDGVKVEPVKPLALSLTMGAGFVARGFSGDIPQLVELMKEAILYKGYAHLDIFQPCVVWNKVNTFQWYKDRVYKLSEDYDQTDFNAAYEKALEFGDKIPTGILYKVEKETYEDRFQFIKDGPPLVDAELNPFDAEKLMKDFY
ncbi:MAG TPA: thiamine pyrophosphate-dependent enzyme, partial [Tissierellaceae bacterium]|nr:thiamine pyrophosphate-dependent enzyme [Tissierellaceae bacterium]